MRYCQLWNRTGARKCQRGNCGRFGTYLQTSKVLSSTMIESDS